jgi:outer membrane protein assembly factor BamB
MRYPGVLLIVLVGCGPAFADDWPQWLGQHRDGATREHVAAWQQPPKVLWRRPVGEGYCSPVVAEGRVFLHARVKDKDEEEVIALDAKTGEPRWRKAYARAPFVSAAGVGPRATPAVILDRVYTFGITGVLSCYDAATGKQFWQKDTAKLFEAKPPRFGYCGSPLVEGNRVLVSVGGKGNCVVAFDTDTGEVAWKALDDPASTSSPIVFMHTPAGGELHREAVFVTSRSVVGLDFFKGTVAWEHPLADMPQGTSPTPVWAGDLVVVGSMKNGTAGLRVADKAGKLEVAEAWKKPDLRAYFATPVVAGKHYLYEITTAVTEQRAESTLRCIDLRGGKELWSKPDVGDYHAALIRTGNDRLLMLNDGGTLKLLTHDPKGYKELASTKACGPTLVSPALADGRLYLRDHQEVICLELPAK